MPADGRFLAHKSEGAEAPNSALTSACPLEGLEVEGFQAKYRGGPLRNSIPCPSPVSPGFPCDGLIALTICSISPLQCTGSGSHSLW